MGPTWGPSEADRTQVGPMLAPWTLLSGTFVIRSLFLVGLLHMCYAKCYNFTYIVDLSIQWPGISFKLSNRNTINVNQCLVIYLASDYFINDTFKSPAYAGSNLNRLRPHISPYTRFKCWKLSGYKYTIRFSLIWLIVKYGIITAMNIHAKLASV